MIQHFKFFKSGANITAENGVDVSSGHATSWSEVSHIQWYQLGDGFSPAYLTFDQITPGTPIVYLSGSETYTSNNWVIFEATEFPTTPNSARRNLAVQFQVMTSEFRS